MGRCVVIGFSPSISEGLAGAGGGEAITDAAEAIGASSMIDALTGQIGVFLVAFIVTVCATPIMRRLAIANGIIDRPNELRKAHSVPIAYLGGVAIFLGIIAGLAFSYIGMTFPAEVYDYHPTSRDLKPIPMSILIGAALITITGLIDDVVGLDPRLKIAGQLVASAALAMESVGTKVAAGIMMPIGRAIGNESLVYTIPDLPILGDVQFDGIYWAGTAIIAVFVLGACNASNLIDGLDGLLTGVTAIAAAFLLYIALHLASVDDGILDGARIALALALLGGCLGFLPHNFNPATIFMGDCGSLLLGYLTIVLILTLGDTGQTHLVIAGLIIYAIPIIDTALAIVRRKLSGKRMSDADDQHLHHMLKRALGVKGAVLTLYAIGALFGCLGAWLTEGRVRVVFTVATVFGAFIGVTAVKIARRQAIESAAVAVDLRRAAQTERAESAEKSAVATGASGAVPSEA